MSLPIPLVPPPPEAAPAAPVGPAGAGVVPPARPITYHKLMSDETNGPTPDRVANYLQGYRFDGAGGVPTPAALRDQTIILSDRQPMAFLCLVTPGVSGVPEVAILHRLMRYMDMPGEEASGFHDSVLGLTGDLMPHQYPTMEVPQTAFHLVSAAIRVPTAGGMAAMTPAWENPAPVPLGPFTEEDRETEVVCTRNIQLIPGYLAALLVHRRGITAKDAYLEIHGTLHARGEVESCRDVLVWLRVACTAQGGGGPHNGLSIVKNAITPVHLPGDVYRYLVGKIRGDLPAISEPDPAAGDITGTLAGALRALTETRTGRGGDGTERATREPKTIQDMYKETYRTLLRYGNVTDIAAVAPIWSRLANASKSEQHTIMTQEFQRVCMARGLSTDIYTPVVTAGLKQMIAGMQFVGHGVDDLCTGCQPFQVAYAGSANHYRALADASVSNQLSQGEQNASLADYRTIREQERIKFPRDITEICITLTRYCVLCQTLFQGAGPDNAFVAAMWQLAASLQNASPFITERYQQVPRMPAFSGVYFACIVRAIQVGVQEYLQSVGTNMVEGHTGVELPDFRTLTTDLRRGTFHQSSQWIPIPEEYLDRPSASSGSGYASAATPSVATTTNSTSGRTSVSTLTADTRGGGTAVQRVDNPAPDTEFASITVAPCGTRRILREHRPPSNNAGKNEFASRGGSTAAVSQTAAVAPRTSHSLMPQSGPDS